MRSKPLLNSFMILSQVRWILYDPWPRGSARMVVHFEVDVRSMVIMATGSFAPTCIEFHAQGNLLVVVISPNAPIVVLVERAVLYFSFASTFLKAFSWALWVWAAGEMRCLIETPSSDE